MDDRPVFFSAWLKVKRIIEGVIITTQFDQRCGVIRFQSRETQYTRLPARYIYLLGKFCFTGTPFIGYSELFLLRVGCIENSHSGLRVFKSK